MKKSIFLFFAAILCATSAWAANAELKNGQFLYCTVNNSNWKSWSITFNWYWNEGDWCCQDNGTKLATDIWYAKIPNDYTRAVQLIRCKTDFSEQWDWSKTVKASSRANDNQNCVNITGSNWGDAAVSWTTYAPPMSSVTLSNNGTVVNSGSGTQADPYIIEIGTTIKVKATGTKAVEDPDATINYDFKQGDTSKQNGTSTTWTLDATDASTVYTIKLDGYTKVNTTSSTTTAATPLYFKTIADVSIPTYQVTVSANDDAMGTVTGGGEYNENATATLNATPNAGYQFVNWTVGGVEKSTNTTYSFTVTEAVEVVANFEVIPTTTVYFVNAEDWTGTINAYAWTDGSPKVENAGWPGVAAHKEDYQIEGHDVYSYTAEEGKYANIIFNGTGGQTADLVWTAGKYVCRNEWYATIAEVEAALATPIPDETVYLINTGNWSKAMIHTWNGVGGTAWPGVEMTKEVEQIAGYDVYSYTAKQGGQANLLFQESENVNKTSDLTWEAGKYYAPSKEKWYDDAAAAAADLAAPVEYEYVYLINTNDWAAAHIYTWTPEVAGWPGAAMTLEAEQIAGKDVYSYKVVKGTTFGGMLFNCGGDECKTGDLTWQAGKYYAPSKDKWYDDAAAAESALNTPAVITYALMGVGGDWTTGITMTYDEENNQYVLTDQVISKATDAVKVAKLSDGSPVEWYNTVDAYTACTYTHVDDGFGGQNIVLEDGTYDFYHKLSNNEIYISKQVPATATITLVDAQEYGATLTLSADECVVGDEITASAQIFDDGFAFAYWKEGENIVSYSADYTFTVEGDRTLEAYFGGNMPVEMADLVVDADAKTITGSNTTDGVTASLKLDDYDSDMDMWSIDPANSTIEFDPLGSGTPVTLDVLYGEIWLDMESHSMATARVVADFGGELFVFNLTMTAATETLEVGVGTELSLEFGALVMRGTWYADEEDEVGYPFKATIGGFNYTVAEAEYRVSVELGEWNDDDDSRWLGFGESVMSVAIEDGKVILVGTVTTNYPINTLNIVAQGSIQILPMDIDVTVAEMDMGDAVYLNLNGTDYESGIDVDLYLNDYTGADKTYELNDASTIADGNAQATGSLTKAGNTYTGVVYASAMGALYVLELNLTEFVPEYENMVVTGLTGVAEARALGWGNEYYLALSLEGTWSDGVVTYPVSIQLADYDPAVTSGTTYVSLTIGGWEDDQEWLGSIDGGEMNFSISGKTITLTGKLDNAYNWPAPIYWDLTITGTILPNYTRDVTAGNFGTLCLPFGGTVEGAELFECVGQETGKVYIASVTKLEAGVPYIFLANANQIAVYCDATVADEAGNHQGLYGTFDDNTVVEAGNYILLNNELRPSDGTAKVNANRAYLVMTEVPTESVQQMPGRRYIGMSTQGENETTGFENIVAPEGETIKAIVNGQLIIIRGGEKFNAQGQKL